MNLGHACQGGVCRRVKEEVQPPWCPCRGNLRNGFAKFSTRSRARDGCSRHREPGTAWTAGTSSLRCGRGWREQWLIQSDRTTSNLTVVAESVVGMDSSVREHRHDLHPRPQPWWRRRSQPPPGPLTSSSPAVSSCRVIKHPAWSFAPPTAGHPAPDESDSAKSRAPVPCPHRQLAKPLAGILRYAPAG
jgi:hypothetical protein